jgi:hypothetical protein
MSAISKEKIKICVLSKIQDIWTEWPDVPINVTVVLKKSLNIHFHVRPNTRNAPTMSDQILGVRGCWLSNLSDISLEWVMTRRSDKCDCCVYKYINRKTGGWRCSALEQTLHQIDSTSLHLLFQRAFLLQRNQFRF